VTNQINRGLWQPATETIDAIAASLSAHWALASSRQADLFWSMRASWLRDSTTLLGYGAAVPVQAVVFARRVRAKIW
jgi:hypothetical protein